MLEIGQVCEAGARSFDTVADCAIRMVQRARRQFNAVKWPQYIAGLELMVLDLGAHVVLGDREVWRPEYAIDQLLRRLTVLHVSSPDPQLRLVPKCGQKIRKADNVIVVDVAEEEIDLRDAFFEKRLAQRNNAAAGIEDHDVTGRANLNA